MNDSREFQCLQGTWVLYCPHLSLLLTVPSEVRGWLFLCQMVFILAPSHDIWDLSSPTRDQTLPP